MWKVIRKYYGELCGEKSLNCEVCEQETVFLSYSFQQTLKEYCKWLNKDEKAGYVIIEKYNLLDWFEHPDTRSLFFSKQKNKNNYIEMSIINEK